MDNRNIYFITPGRKPGTGYESMRIGGEVGEYRVLAREAVDCQAITRAAVSWLCAKQAHAAFKHRDYSTQEYSERCDVWIKEVQSEKELAELVEKYGNRP